MADTQNLVERLERAVGHLKAGSVPLTRTVGVETVLQKQERLHSPVAEYLKIGKEIGGDVQKHMRRRPTQPAGNKLSDLLAPISEQIQEVITFREKNRGSKLFNHLSAVSESIQALGWEYKDVGWVKAYLSIWTELQAYIKEFHTTGLAWSKTGPSGSDESASRSALFAQVNQGESIAHALKLVSDDMKTQKNPALNAQSAPVRSSPKPFSASKPGVSPSPKPVTKKEPALLELKGKKWRVENQENVSNLVIDDTELKQAAYIFKCVNSTLQIKSKINSTTVDNCKKLGLVFNDVVGIVEIINCRDVKVQVMGKVPTISINKTDGCHVYLSKNSLDCEIVSAKSSEMNVLIPTEGDDFNELPDPEQFKTVWNGQKLVTTVTEIAG
ncbi:hypothetical protein EI555_000527 [Monodon monoceros]|uniref:Adenylyl cyclase-associated protein 1 n=1 Tax=Monodon monoceros TaxID=40151 RepID=A0A4U1F8I0_MONMO|nr:hypothetical protein EI555_000527 [Monodon monoceros]